MTQNSTLSPVETTAPAPDNDTLSRPAAPLPNDNATSQPLTPASGSGRAPLPAPPAFFTQFATAVASGEANSFIFHGNVNDLVTYDPAPTHLIRYLTAALARFDLVVLYNRAEGITFPLASQEQKARELLAASQPVAPAANASPLAALMNSNSQPQQSPAWPKAPAAALRTIDALLKAVRRQPAGENGPIRLALIVEYPETIMPEGQLAFLSPDDRDVLVLLQQWGKAPARLDGDFNLVLLVTHTLAELHPAVRAARYRAIEIGKPNAEQRRAYAEWYLAHGPDITMQISVAEFANATAGLTYTQLEDVFLRAAAGGRVTRRLVKEIKDLIISQEYAGLVKILDPQAGFDAVGGMELLKTWCRREIIEPLQRGLVDDAVKGFVMAGAPGTGKTWFASALAYELGYNALAVSMNSILGQYVGVSEQNLAKVLGLAEALSPVIFFMDELDQSDGSSRGQGSGNPVAANLFNQMLQFLGRPDLRGKVIFVAATNRPDLIDAALMRFGRIDAVVPVLLPEEDDRRLIIETQARLQGTRIEPAAVDLLARGTNRYAAADLEAVIRKARKIARAADHPAITLPDAQMALETIKPATITQADFFEMLAIQAVNDTELLPPKYAALLDDRGALDKEIDAQRPDGGGRRGMAL